MDLLCSEIKHRWGESADGGHIEIFYSTLPNGETIIHKKQPIPEAKPSITPPDRVGLDNGWCVAKPIETTPVEATTSDTSETEATAEAGMGSFFLLVLVITGGIAVFQNYRKKLDTEFSEPKFLPSPWVNELSSDHRVVPRGYGDYIEQEYPPLPEERLDTDTSIIPSARQHQPDANRPTPLTPETLTAMGPTKHQPTLQPDSNQAPTGLQPEFQPDSKQAPTGTLTFDPRDPEKSGEFELFQALIKINKWSPKGKEILKALWAAQPKTKRYEPAVERRNQFAVRLSEYVVNEQ